MALFLFDTEINLLTETLPNNRELSLVLGSKTIVHFASTQSLNYVGLSLDSGGSPVTPVDKMLVCLSNVNNNSFVQSFSHESVSATSPNFRFRNAAQTTVDGGTGAGAIWYQYYAVQLRWIMIGKTA